MKRKKILNILLPAAQEVISVICGIILPRLIIVRYGSAVNGLMTSIGQFLSVIGFFEAGVGSVVRYNFYKPLSDNDPAAVSRIAVSAERFFRRLALGLLLYALLLTVIYPLAVHTDYPKLSTAFLILALCAGTFAEYFWGEVNTLLLTADQRRYIYCIVQIATVILNTAVSILLITMGAGICFVKLCSACIFLIRPLVLRMYVSGHYGIDRHIAVEGEPIRQKWNGLAQHVAYVVLESTDVVVLSLFSSLTQVSVYSVHNMVVSNLKKLFTSMNVSLEAIVGKSIAEGDRVRLNREFKWIEWALHTSVTIVFSCAFVLLVPFVSVYTREIRDADYIYPTFALLIAAANYFHALRLPYSAVILSGGFYKETEKCYIIAALVNVTASVLLVVRFGLIGVSAGTILSMGFQNVWMARFVYRKVMEKRWTGFLRQLSADLLSAGLVYLLFRSAAPEERTYTAWILLALRVFPAACVISLAVNAVFYGENLKELILVIRKKLEVRNVRY